MSRLGKKPIIIPSGVDVQIRDGFLFAKGPHGESRMQINNNINFDISDNKIIISPKEGLENPSVLWGTYSSHVLNMIHGATKGFEKRLAIEGVGFKAQTEGAVLSLSLGLSHPIKINIPKDVNVKVEKNIIILSGVDKQIVGAFAAKIKSFKKPEPYKGKGIKYEGEIIRRKAGKKAATSAA